MHLWTYARTDRRPTQKHNASSPSTGLVEAWKSNVYQFLWQSQASCFFCKHSEARLPVCYFRHNAALTEALDLTPALCWNISNSNNKVILCFTQQMMPIICCRLHHMHCINVAHCYTCCMLHWLSICLSVSVLGTPISLSWTKRYAIWDVDFCGATNNVTYTKNATELL